MNTSKLQIRSTIPEDFDALMNIHEQAFPEEDVASLVAGLLEDKTAEPIVSLLALIDGKPAGHILFTRAWIEGLSLQPLIHILAPLAVLPDHQKTGIGGQLIEAGIRELKVLNCDLVFVLGHETYYPKYGFIPDAKSFGFPATYAIPEEVKGAWMVYPLKEGAMDKAKGKIICADFMNKEEYWQE